MSLIQQLKQAQDFTEREKDIARFVLEHPETIENMSSRELGHQTFTSAASVTRFCQKLGVKGFPEFKIKFVSELRDGYLDEKQEKIMMSERENPRIIPPIKFGIKNTVRKIFFPRTGFVNTIATANASTLINNMESTVNNTVYHRECKNVGS